MAEVGQQAVELSKLVCRAAEDSYLSLKELVEKSVSSEQSDAEKKISLLKYILRTRQRMLRLHVLAKWCQQVPLIHYCEQLSSTLSNHDTCFTQAADSLFFLHEGLQQARAPIYDVPSAIEVLLTGTYKRIPKCVEDMGMQNTLTGNEQKPALKKLDTLIRTNLLEAKIPEEISQINISDGTALIRVNGEFEVLLTLGYRGHLSLWRILHLELLVGETTGPLKLEDMRRHALGDDLERRMATSDNPFMLLYSILHELCIALIMDTVIRQVHTLRQGRWKDAIRFELLSGGNTMGQGHMSLSQACQDVDVDLGGLRAPGLKVIYWLENDRNVGRGDADQSPFIKIEPGEYLDIKCVHSTFIIDPVTGKEAQLCLDQGCIDVEMVLLKAISCNRHTQLLAIFRELSKNNLIYQAARDIDLRRHEYKPDADLEKMDNKLNVAYLENDEALLVRAYGALYFTLGMNIRTGSFFLQAPRNILPVSVVSDCEEAFNQGGMGAAEVFLCLRSKSILTLFASVGRFLGLKVYEESSAAVKIPKTLLNSSQFLLMGFPQCGTSYHLLMQLDKEFKLQFGLLERQPDPSGLSSLISSSDHVIRFNKINIRGIKIVEDMLSLSVLDWEKMQVALPDVIYPSPILEGNIFPKHGMDVSAHVCPQSSFESVVDEMFGCGEGPPISPYPVKDNAHSPFNISTAKSNSIDMNCQMMKSGLVASKCENNSKFFQLNNTTRPLSGDLSVNNLLYASSDSKCLLQPDGPVKQPSLQELSASSAIKEFSLSSSPQSVELATGNDDQGWSLSGTQEDQPCHLSSPFRNDFQGSPLAGVACTGKAGGSAAMIGHKQKSSIRHEPNCIISKDDKNKRKRSILNIIEQVPSLRELVPNTKSCKKKRKIGMSYVASSHSNCQSALNCNSELFHGDVIRDYHGPVHSSIYITAFSHVIRHCSLCIKHALLTSQMEALNIPYVEEVGLGALSLNIWFQLPFAQDEPWQHTCLYLGSPGSMHWNVIVSDQYFRYLWDLQTGNANSSWGSGVFLANLSDVDSHIHYAIDGVILSYQTVQEDSIKKLVADLRRLFNARLFASEMRKLLGARREDGGEEALESNAPGGLKIVQHGTKVNENASKAFRIEAVGLMSVWFCFVSAPGIITRFVVEWVAGKEGCSVHVSPDQIWPHTKFLEDFINAFEVVSLLDCIRLTAGPLLALAGAIHPARVPTCTPGTHCSTANVLNALHPCQPPLTSNSSSTVVSQPASGGDLSSGGSVSGTHSLHTSSPPGKGGPGIVPNSLLPTDVSVVLRGPYWIRIIYRKDFAVDMRCFAGDQVWLQPATPAKGSSPVGGSLPCPQLMDHISQGLHTLESITTGGYTVGPVNTNNLHFSTSSQPLAVGNGNRTSLVNSGGVSKTTSQGSSMNRMGSSIMTSALGASGSSPLRISPGAGIAVHIRDSNTSFIGFGDCGGYGGGWAPHVALKKVLRAVLKYFGVLWLFAQLPELLKDILGSILKENEGALLNLDQEQPLLHFFVGGYVFAVSVHRVQLLLQVVSVKRFHQQQQQSQTGVQEELAHSETSEICDYFSRRVALEPYDASRVASFVTLLTLPIPVLREFLRLIAWKKILLQTQAQSGTEAVSLQRPRVELTLENHSGWTDGENLTCSTAKSSVWHDRLNSMVEFGLTIVLDPSQVPHVNVAGGASWLPYCVLVRLRYFFGENPHVDLVGIQGSHGGQACWLISGEWEWCKQRISRAVEYGNSSSPGDPSQGRLKVVADTLQRALQVSLQQFRDGSASSVPIT